MPGISTVLLLLLRAVRKDDPEQLQFISIVRFVNAVRAKNFKNSTKLI